MTASDADVVVVGAGPSGSAAATHLARAGLAVVALEKTRFPREKVCGDGLTPRAVRQLHALGIDTGPGSGWVRNHGLRIVSGGRAVEVPWPRVPGFPDYGLVRPRADLDALLARGARVAGADVREGTSVTGLVRDRSGRVAGVLAHDVDERGRRAGPDRAVRARVVIAADGPAGRTAIADARHRDPARPVGVAVRAYYRSPRHADPWLETWLELPDSTGRLLPGYGWVFGMGDGLVNVGVGLLDASAAPHADPRDLLRGWLPALPEGHGISEESRCSAVKGAPLPMGLNRRPAYARGLVLVGDAAGLVNPFNGEGISYALESGSLAARVVAAALQQPSAVARERSLQGYPATVAAGLGGYYALGRTFLRLLDDPRVAAFATGHGTHHPRALAATLRMLANLADPSSGRVVDETLALLASLVPARSR